MIADVHALAMNRHDAQCANNFNCGLLCLLQVDQHAKEDFNLTSDTEFNAIKSIVIGKVHGE